MAAAPDTEAFLLELAQALHRHGLPAYRIEDALVRVGQRLGVELQIFSVPTGLTVGLGPTERQVVRLVRVSPGSVRLARIAELTELIERIVDGELGIEAAHARLREIEREPPPHRPLAVAGAYALASSASAVFFGASAAEAVLAAVIGCAVGVLLNLARRIERLARLLLVLGSAGAALAAGLATLAPLGVRRELVTLAAIIVLMPGHTLTVALNELVFGHLSSGTARLGGVFATLLLLGCGAAVGTAAADAALTLLPEAAPVEAVALPAYAYWIALLAAPLAFKVLFQARDADTLWIVAAAVLANLGARLGLQVLGPFLGPGCGAFVLGLLSNTLARIRHRPAQITSTPGLLVLVPGSIGFRGVSSLLIDGVRSPGAELVSSMLAIGVSLVCGLLLASVVVRSKRTF